MITIIFFLLGNISPAGAAGLTVEQIKNSPFYIRGWEDETQGEWVQLHDGRYSRTNPDDQLFLEMHQIVLGHLSASRTKDAAVIYGVNYGGTGNFYILSVLANDQGRPKNIAQAELGDRVKINSLAIKSGKITIDMITHGPHDPACCPSVKKIAVYTLSGNKLVEK
jgi:hypothetical protein